MCIGIAILAVLLADLYRLFIHYLSNRLFKAFTIFVSIVFDNYFNIKMWEIVFSIAIMYMLLLHTRINNGGVCRNKTTAINNGGVCRNKTTAIKHGSRSLFMHQLFCRQ